MEPSAEAAHLETSGPGTPTDMTLPDAHHADEAGGLAGQTEAYTRASSPWLRAFIHGFNNWWFRYSKVPSLAFGNIVVLRKETGR
jgi:hypothetical protein